MKRQKITLGAAAKFAIGFNVWCPHCKRGSTIPQDKTLSLGPPDIRLDQIEARLRCKKCGARGGEISIQSNSC